jgi:lysophospholipase L1-like esterase
MKSLNIWSGLCAAALALALPGMVQGQAGDAPRFVAETPTLRVDYWQMRASNIGKELSTAQSLEPVRLVFVGDSITDFWHLDANPWFPGLYCGWSVWNESFGGAVPQHKALNLGVSGDRIEHVLHRLLPATQGGEGWLDRPDLQPDTVFVMLGINNSFDAEKPATTSIVKGVEAVVARLRERKPKARIVIQSLLPTEDATKNRDLVQPVNAALRTHATTLPNTAFLDLYPSFVDEAGLQRRVLFNDALHPSRDGYRVWRDRLVAFLTASPTAKAPSGG